MKPIHISEDIVPLGTFKSQASKILRRLHDEDRPIVITQHGRPAAVLLRPEEFDRLSERQRFLEAVREGMAESERGEVIADEDLDLDALP